MEIQTRKEKRETYEPNAVHHPHDCKIPRQQEQQAIERKRANTHLRRNSRAQWKHGTHSAIMAGSAHEGQREGTTGNNKRTHIPTRVTCTSLLRYQLRHCRCSCLRGIICFSRAHGCRFEVNISLNMQTGQESNNESLKRWRFFYLL